MSKWTEPEIERLKNNEPITNLRFELDRFIFFMRDVGRVSLQSEIPDEETKAMLRWAIPKFIESTPELTRFIETSCKWDHEREYFLAKLWDAIAAAYKIGYCTTSQENATAVKREDGRRVNKNSVARWNEDPTNKIIESVLDLRYMPGDEKHADKMGRAMMDEVNRLQKVAGLPPLKRPDRIARAISKRAKSPRC